MKSKHNRSKQRSDEIDRMLEMFNKEEHKSNVFFKHKDKFYIVYHNGKDAILQLAEKEVQDNTDINHLVFYLIGYNEKINQYECYFNEYGNCYLFTQEVNSLDDILNNSKTIKIPKQK